MNVTILFKGKNARFVKRFSLRRIISAAVLCSLVLLVSSRSTESVYENQTRVQLVKTSLEQQAEQVRQLKLHTQSKVVGLVDQVAGLNHRITQLETLTETLAGQAGLTREDFTLPPELKANLQADLPLLEQIEATEATLDFKIQQLSALESILLGLNIEKESALSGRPIGEGWLSSYYGVRKDPFSGKPAMHKGIDFAGKEGDNVIATAAGVVTWSGDRYGYGKLVEIDHGNGIKTRYGHNQALKVEVGEIVTKGQAIAAIGNTGRSTGAHVHYEVIKNGRQVDPLPYIYR